MRAPFRVMALKRNYGEAEIERFSREVGARSSTVWQYAHAYQAFKNSERSDFLSWSHHLIASYSEDPKAALKEAETKKLSVEGLRLIVKGKVERKRLTDPGLVNELP